MAHGNVNNETLLAYIKNSGKIYPLGASEIIYLREQGLSDQVLTAMLEQSRNVAPAVPQPAQSSVWANSTPPPPAPVATQPAPAYTTAPAVYAQPAPVYSYPAYTYPAYTYPAYYYGYGPYYGAYWGYPALSFSFGWGGYYGGHYYGGYHGGYHGGGHYGGGHYGGGHH
jgi:hypothetical protein